MAFMPGGNLLQAFLKNLRRFFLKGLCDRLLCPLKIEVLLECLAGEAHKPKRYTVICDGR